MAERLTKTQTRADQLAETVADTRIKLQTAEAREHDLSKQFAAATKEIQQARAEARASADEAAGQTRRTGGGHQSGEARQLGGATRAQGLSARTGPFPVGVRSPLQPSISVPLCRSRFRMRNLARCVRDAQGWTAGQFPQGDEHTGRKRPSTSPCPSRQARIRQGVHARDE